MPRSPPLRGGTAGCLCSSQSNAAVSGRPLRSYNPASCLAPAARHRGGRNGEIGRIGILRTWAPRGSIAHGGREGASTDRHLHGVHVLPRALAQSIVQDVSRSTRETERGTWDGRRGERPMSAPGRRRFQVPSIGPSRRFRASF